MQKFRLCSDLHSNDHTFNHNSQCALGADEELRKVGTGGGLLGALPSFDDLSVR